MTLVKVAHDATPVKARLRDIDKGISAFLGAHIKGLRNMAAKSGSVPGRCEELEARGLFRNLCSGKDGPFLAAADSFSARLAGRMDARSAKGLLVCLRADDGEERYGGVLKLQVKATDAAVLEELSSGEIRLSAVRDLLDTPGELQKGALSASWLAEEQVLIGDRLGREAEYFTRALAIRPFARPSTAVNELFAAIGEVSPDLALPIAEALPGVSPGTSDSVLAALGQKVPGLHPGVQADISDVLAHQVRPVSDIDTSRTPKETITIGDIKITGPVPQMKRHVRIEKHGDAVAEERWTITIDSPTEPKTSYRN